MSLNNPTRLRIGMHGTFSGKNYRVTGRMALGENENGAIYYWNEFHLETAAGDEATLVFERTQRGDEWRLFTMFDPATPLTADEAAKKRVGDPINLTRKNLRVTFRNRSHVYLIEGKVPDWIKVGSEANYFNAESGSVMEVVSWTGAEMEFYEGVTLSRGVVSGAFNLPMDPNIFAGLAGRLGRNSQTLGNTVMWLIALLIVLVFLGQDLSCSNRFEAWPVKRVLAGAAPLVVGESGKLAGVNYRITGHGVVEIAEVGNRQERHEYELTDDDGNRALLVCGTNSTDVHWLLFTPVIAVWPPSPQDCASKKLGDAVSVEGVEGTVRELFSSTVEQVDGMPTGFWEIGATRYGYLATSAHDILLVRWDANAVTFHHGSPYRKNELVTAFAGSAGK